jgi:hypothetical protein
MPTEAVHPLAVVFTLPGNVTHVGHLDDLPDQALAAGLAAGLVATSHPHGPIRTRSVARKYVTTVRRLARDLHAAGFSGGIADLTPATIVQYWLTCDYHRERCIRVVLRSYDAVAGDVHPGIREHLAGRRINRIAKGRPNRPYSDGEWQRLTKACTEVISFAYRAHEQAMEAAERGDNPAIHGPTPDNLAWLVRHAGLVPAGTLFAGLGEHAGSPAVRHEALAIRRALYPNGNVAFAYLLLLSMRTGIVPDGIDGLTLSDITRTGESSVLLSYVKGRTGGESLNLARDAVRLLDRWLAHSAALREHAGAMADQVWIYEVSHGASVTDAIRARPRSQYQRLSLVAQNDVLGDDGQPLAIHGGRVRATYHHRRDRSSWTGRATIDPNHSARVEGDHYLSSHTPAQLDAIEGIIEQAQTDLRRKAEPPVVLTSDDAASFAASFPRLVQAAGLGLDAITALLAGEQDVFVAACAAPLNSPHAPAGTLCPARPWVCLLCPLSAFAPRHLPNLLRLKEFFSRQAAQMTTAGFMALFGPYATRLEGDILPRFATAAIEAAARNVAASTADLPLHLEEVPM